MPSCHPSDVVSGLIGLGVSSEEPIKLNFVKAAHHGSKKNTSDELLSLIETNTFVFTANRITNQHPDKAALSRIHEVINSFHTIDVNREAINLKTRDKVAGINIPRDLRAARKILQEKRMPRKALTESAQNGSKSRIYDTEMKFIYDFFKNHLHEGDRFVINFQSVLYNCESHKQYMQILKRYGELYGKEIKITFTSNKDIVRISDLK